MHTYWASGYIDVRVGAYILDLGVGAYILDLGGSVEDGAGVKAVASGTGVS